LNRRAILRRERLWMKRLKRIERKIAKKKAVAKRMASKENRHINSKIESLKRKISSEKNTDRKDYLKTKLRKLERKAIKLKSDIKHAERQRIRHVKRS
jgi:hypothetical protein